MKCNSEKRTIGLLYIERNAINESPDYQRESAIWAPEKKSLFIDSLLQNFDIPKFYFHDQRELHLPKEFAIVDGKQRLSTIFSFMDDEFTVSIGNEDKKYSDLSTHEKEKFKAINLDVVMIQNADEDDIEELFSRLNNGEPLNAAEKRNAFGGDMCRYIREISETDFFTHYLPYADKRFKYLDLAIRLIQIEHHKLKSTGIPDSKKKFLDQIVKDNKNLDDLIKQKIDKSLSNGLAKLKSVFSKKDALLKKQSTIPLYYIFIDEILTKYTYKNLPQKINEFLCEFNAERTINNQKPEDERDPILIDFGRLSTSGTNDTGNVTQRISILHRYLLKFLPDIEVKDQQRLFTEDERFAIWVKAGKKCNSCFKQISLDEMEADHVRAWAKGGKTILSNAQALCTDCNQKKSNK